MLSVTSHLNTYGSDADSGKKASFSPYENNQGTIVAVSGEDFAVIASDTRLSDGFSIHTRKQPKLFKLSSKTVLGSCGCWCDVLTFTRILETRMKMYEHEHNQEMSTPAVSQLSSCMLYYKRFFPYYVFNVIAGLDDEGRGRVYSFDSIGHRSQEHFRSVGSSNELIQPLLDNQIGGKNMENVGTVQLSLEDTVAIVKDVFTAAAERDIHTGDGLVINIITKDGIQEQYFPLRTD